MAVAAAKKVVDSWKAKKWFKVIAPNFLNNIEAADVPAVEDESLLNRIIEIPLKEITRDINHLYTSIKLRIYELRGRKALSKFIGHSIAREYLRTLIRRRREVVETVFRAVSKDGVEFRVKAMAVTENRCSERQKHSLRVMLEKEILANAKASEFGAFVKDVIFGKTPAELEKSLAKITPVRRVEIWKTELKEEFDTQEVEELPSERKEEEPAQAQEVKQETRAEEELPADAPAAVPA